ncbi:hypothetical protein [Rhodanobacter fulvus]|uniref:hypothetical protein n=1 Tax=Rhodanobacter fulvus TaxID=219571 RepID=UPI0012EA10BB|nr:hypothetical protein [Rhodanobacter fulvus]
MKMRGVVVFFALLPYAAIAAQSADFRAETNRYYTGTIDGKYAFDMVLSVEGDACMGSYYYLKYKKPIFLYGKCSTSTFNLQEQQRQSGYTAGVGFEERGQHKTITGRIAGNIMSGFWHSSRNGKSYSFSAKEVDPDKRRILENAVGTYKLSNISAFCCANSMADYTKNAGSWGATGSAISDGRREASDDSFISERDQHLLSSFTLQMDQSLGIHLFSGQQLIANFPYASGATFSVRNITQAEDKLNNIGRIFKYEGINSFVGNVVHISTTDEFKLLQYVPAPLQELSSRHAISVDYNPSAMQFQITIISEQCCDNATLYLSKQQ